MKLFQRSFFLLLTLLLVFSSLTACQRAGKEEPTQAEQSSVEEQRSTSIVLSDKSSARYTVVRPSDSTDLLLEWMQAVMEYPAQHQKESLNLPWTTDKSEDRGSEILLGYTNRPESREVMESIGYDDFAIVTKGDKIVVAAHREERLQQAVTYLCENLLKIESDENGNSSFVYLGDYSFVSQERGFFFNAQNKLADYSIIYRQDSAVLKGAAEELQARIKEYCGIEIKVASDSSPETSQEIVLGRTNRALSQKYFAKETGAYSFASVIVAEDQKLLIGSATDETTVLAVQRFAEEYIQSEYSYTFNLDAEIDLLDTGYSFSESPELAEDAEMRIMSFNILCELWDSKAKDVESRMKIVLATLLTYSPEVVGLQEVSDKCYQSLNPLFEGTYAFVDTKTEKGKTNFSPLAYNVEKVTLLEHGVKTLASGNNPSLRVISWGYFERKSDGERFFVANTHWDLTAMPESRTKQAIEMGDFAVAMKEKYNCPVITVGDYNTQSHQEQFQTYLDHSKLSDAGLTAKVINRNFKSTHKLFEDPVPAPDTLAIDHIFYSSDIEALYYNMLIDKTVIDASDHFPVYADIRFKK